MSERVLVTGGAGYIGSHLCPLLVEKGYAVRVLDRDLYRSPAVARFQAMEGCEYVNGDIRHIEDLVPAVRDVDAVIDLAAIVGDQACEQDPGAAETINLHGTELLLRLCQRYEVERLLFASTCSVYGASGDESLVETSPPKPLSLYARTKLESERILLASGDALPHVTVFRLATVFGLSTRMRFDLVLNFFAARAAQGVPLVVHGGSQVRPLVHARDVARAFLRGLESDTEAVSGQIFNVGSDEQNVTILDLAEQIALCGSNVPVDQRPAETDPRNYRVSFEKILSHLSYRVETEIRTGAEEIIEAIQEGAIADPLDDRYYNVRYAFRTL